jgi:WD40 repeat protein
MGQRLFLAHWTVPFASGMWPQGLKHSRLHKGILPHTYAIHSLAFSSDGTKVVSGSDDRTLCIWDVISGVKVLEMKGHEGKVRSVKFSPDGHQIVSGSSDRTVRIWNATAGNEVIPPHTNDVVSVAFSPGGQKIASGSLDVTIRVWDAISGAQIAEIRGHTEGISSVVFSPDECRIISSSWDCDVRVWDVITGAQVFPRFHGHKSWVRSVFFSPDASRIISQSGFESLSWDAITGLRIHSTEEADHRLSGSMYITHDGWIMDSMTERTLGKLPSMLAHPVYVVHERSLVVATYSGRIFVLHFPPALFTSPDTRVVEGKRRKRFKST